MADGDDHDEDRGVFLAAGGDGRDAAETELQRAERTDSPASGQNIGARGGQIIGWEGGQSIAGQRRQIIGWEGKRNAGGQSRKIIGWEGRESVTQSYRPVGTSGIRQSGMPIAKHWISVQAGRANTGVPVQRTYRAAGPAAIRPARPQIVKRAFEKNPRRRDRD